MRILVIGGTQFIGAAAVRRLADEGHTVAVFNRAVTPNVLPPGVMRIRGDVIALGASRGDFKKFTPDVVLHNIVLGERHAADLMNVFDGIAGRVVMTGSADAYLMYGRLIGAEPGDPVPVPATEDSPLREKLYPYRGSARGPEDPMYSYDKIPAERLVLGSKSLPGTVVRLPMVFGPNDPQRRLLPFVRQMLDGRPYIVLPSSYAAWRSTYGYVDNMGRALAAACTNPSASAKVFNAGDAALSVLELARNVAGRLGWTGELATLPEEEVPEELAVGMDLRQHLVTSTERIRTELGVFPEVPVDEAIGLTVEWEKEHRNVELPESVLKYRAQDEAYARIGKGRGAP